MRKRVTQIALLVFYVLLLLSTIFPAIPGESIWFPILIGVSIIPVLLGPELYRLAGFVTLILAVILWYGDIKYGKIYQEKRAKRLQAIMQDREINR
jgi:uncharacterized membrane protein